MKGFFVYFSILLAALFALCGCRTREDLIPKELGAPEGLWLYRGAERMRTDGSDREPLFDEIELDGEIYTAEDYTVRHYDYCTDTKTVFFVLTMESGDYLYAYNYAEKSGKQLSEATEWYSCAISDFYICFKSSDGADIVQSLYLRDGTLICEGLKGFDLKQDILYKRERSEEGNSLVWWKDGVLHSVPIPDWEGYSDDFYDGEFLFHFTEDGGGLAVDVDTEEVYPISYEGSYRSESSYESEAHGGVFWFITREVNYVMEGSLSYSEIYSHLYRFTTAGCERVYSFAEGIVALCSATDEAVYLCLYDAHWKTDYQYYDIASGGLKSGKLIKEPEDNTFTCGEYTFWTGYEHYGYFGKCTYLYRRHGDKVEIMQYAFDGEFHFDLNDKFFDDICDV